MYRTLIGIHNTYKERPVPHVSIRSGFALVAGIPKFIITKFDDFLTNQCPDKLTNIQTVRVLKSRENMWSAAHYLDIFYVTLNK